MSDIFDAGIPKYRSPQCIYEGLQELTQSKEIGLLSEIFHDVSWERQGYIYQEKGDHLLAKFEELSDYCSKMWTLDIAVWQLDKGEINDLIFEALTNSDFARRIGLKKLFVDKMLNGDDRGYKAIIAEYEAAVRELNRFDSRDMALAFVDLMKPRGREFIHESPYWVYNNFAWYFSDKANRIDVREEAILVAECRTLLTSYDDFLHGLRVNQDLYEYLNRAFSSHQAKLQSEYEKKVNALLMAAEKHGLLEAITADIDFNLQPKLLLLEMKEVAGLHVQAKDDKGGRL